MGVSVTVMVVALGCPLRNLQLVSHRVDFQLSGAA